jgi:carbon storage regulator CsrA
MLVLSRRSRETVVVGGVDGLDRLVSVTVLDIAAGKVRLGFEAPDAVPVSANKCGSASMRPVRLRKRRMDHPR